MAVANIAWWPSHLAFRNEAFAELAMPYGSVRAFIKRESMTKEHWTDVITPVDAIQYEGVWSSAVFPGDSALEVTFRW